jgi:signal transduction histidine kinase
MLPSGTMAAYAPGTPGEALALRANKLDLLERLADDLAHEIKNPLHSMVINLEVLKRRVARVTGEQDDVQRYIGVLAGELERVNRRIELLLRLSRPGRGAESTTLNELVEELMELIQLEARHHEATVDYQPGDHAARVHIPREPARQAILNLVLDVIDGLQAGSVLRLSISRVDGSARLAVEGSAGTVETVSGESRIAAARSLAEAMGGRVDPLLPEGGTPGEAAGAVLVLPLAGG